MWSVLGLAAFPFPASEEPGTNFSSTGWLGNFDRIRTPDLRHWRVMHYSFGLRVKSKIKKKKNNSSTHWWYFKMKMALFLHMVLSPFACLLSINIQLPVTCSVNTNRKQNQCLVCPLFSLWLPVLSMCLQSLRCLPANLSAVLNVWYAELFRKAQSSLPFTFIPAVS